MLRFPVQHQLFQQPKPFFYVLTDDARVVQPVEAGIDPVLELSAFRAVRVVGLVLSQVSEQIALTETGSAGGVFKGKGFMIDSSWSRP